MKRCVISIGFQAFHWLLLILSALSYHLKLRNSILPFLTTIPLNFALVSGISYFVWQIHDPFNVPSAICCINLSSPLIRTGYLGPYLIIDLLGEIPAAITFREEICIHFCLSYVLLSEIEFWRRYLSVEEGVDEKPRSCNPIYV
ncbi:hypothetical protein BCR34DRAFT_599522 [Clohesyomyces aquaticus]|uniref:Uncharacterized protein n=1 Tax=Clohesyomyces aquaticus TaxID=1231657 RepID=A0A1Y1ZUM5_9PLEO|nr:hypothetical protein BCR34DRAFT_599522 [Clohesyomyces aquaticus]